MEGWEECCYDMVLSRFILISATDPWSAICNAHRALKSGGLMVAIESSHTVAQTLCTSPTMADFCRRMMRWCGRIGSDPKLGPRLWHWPPGNLALCIQMYFRRGTLTRSARLSCMSLRQTCLVAWPRTLLWPRKTEAPLQLPVPGSAPKQESCSVSLDPLFTEGMKEAAPPHRVDGFQQCLHVRMKDSLAAVLGVCGIDPQLVGRDTQQFLQGLAMPLQTQTCSLQ